MAKKTEETTKVDTTSSAVSEDTYPVEELIAASREVFGVPQECVVAALKPLKRKDITVSEAKAVIKKKKKKEVK